MPSGSSALARSRHERQGLAGADAGLRRAVHLDGREQIVAWHPIGAGDIAEIDEVGERHHLPGLVAHADARDVLGLHAEAGIGLRRDAERAPEHVEVVDVGRAEVDAQRLEDRLQRHVQHLRLVAIDVDVELRRAGREGGEHVADAGHLVGRGDEVVGHLLELRRGHVGAVLQAHREASLPAHAAHRRRDGDRGLRFLDVAEPRGDVVGDLVDGQALARRARADRR